jgi:predicted transcriptional regulator
MVSRFSQLIFLFFATAFGALIVNAQIPDASGRDSRSGRQEELPKSLKENIQKGRIEEEKKEYEAMIKRGEEAAKLSEELSKSFEQNQTLSSEDVKKLARLEKLVKKIRDDLGGEDDDEAEANKPSSLLTALKSVQENASSLLTALKKTTRLTISAVAIETSNTVLKLVRFIRFYKN